MVQASSNPTLVPPNLAEFLSRRMRDISARINCHMIGTIVSFNPLNQTAVINVNFLKTLQGVTPIGDTGNSADQVISYPQLVDVPIIVMQGGGAYLTFPIAAGDSCFLLFCDRDMDNWFQAGLIAAPNSSRVHDINDAVALVGIKNLTNPISNYNANIVSLVDRTGERLAQSGDLKATARSTAPSGWLLAYGQSLATATYPDLFAAIGYTFGGTGANFNVPDLRGRIPVGIDNMGGSDANNLTATYTPNRNTLGGSIGEETHLLTGLESGIQQHHHGIDIVNIDTGNGGRIPWDSQTSIQGTLNTNDVANTNAVNPHYNVQPGMMINWCIKL